MSPDATPMKGIKRSPSAHDRPPGAVPGFRPTRKVREGNVFDLHSNVSTLTFETFLIAPGGKSSMGDLLFGGYNN